MSPEASDLQRTPRPLLEHELVVAVEGERRLAAGQSLERGPDELVAPARDEPAGGTVLEEGGDVGPGGEDGRVELQLARPLACVGAGEGDDGLVEALEGVSWRNLELVGRERAAPRHGSEEVVGRPPVRWRLSTPRTD